MVKNTLFRRRYFRTLKNLRIPNKNDRILSGRLFWWEWLISSARCACGETVTARLRYTYLAYLFSNLRLSSHGPNPINHIAPKQKHTIKVCLCFWWEWLDSNQLSHKTTDLQSAPALQLRRTPNLVLPLSWLAIRSLGVGWCGQRESNPHFKLGRLAY